jgi:23S rRNA pseudouridine2605 synthase
MTDENDTIRRGDRIAKVLARRGICSRREAERWIEAGRVSLNGEILASPAINVADDDEIKVDGKAIPGAEPMRAWRYNKPRGLVTTHKDPEGRPTVFEDIPKSLPRVVSVGRLDINSEGLIILTNDGQLSRVLELPSTGWVRRYRVRVFGKVTPEDLHRLTQGVTIDGMRYEATEATLQRQTNDNSWILVGLKEGKNREVKRMMESLGCKVSRLIRISYGPFQLGNLEAGKVEEIQTRSLHEQLGPRLGKDLGLAPLKPKLRAADNKSGAKPPRGNPKGKSLRKNNSPGSRPQNNSQGKSQSRPQGRPSDGKPGARKPAGRKSSGPGRRR